MDEALQRWCVESLAVARDRSSSICDDEKRSGCESSVESRVETAAFLKLSESRRCGVTQVISHPAFSLADGDGFVQSRASTCPLDEASPVEALGLIHQFLISGRADRSGRSSTGKSKSRKANGVFYTPPEVVEYIVGQTLDPRMRPMNPDQAETLMILDPACGSGAFLVRAYRALMEWHLKWFVENGPEQWPRDVERTDNGWRLTFARRWAILRNNVFGVDLDAGALVAARRSLWLTMFEEPVQVNKVDLSAADWNQLAVNVKQGHALIGPAFCESASTGDTPSDVPQFCWTTEFPSVAAQGGFDVILGNPPYRRERDFKRELEAIALTPLGRYRSPRMDLWYYFVHRAIQLLRDGGVLSFITNAYWMSGKGAEKLIAALRKDVHLDELFLLRNNPVFPGVSGQHQILLATKGRCESPTRIKIPSNPDAVTGEPASLRHQSVTTFFKTPEQLFRNGLLHVGPPADGFLERMTAFPRLVEMGVVRQGIAENPSTINRRTLDRFREEPAAQEWVLGEGVFSLTLHELKRLCLSADEIDVIRPYHDLCDLRRYWSAAEPSRRLIYSTRKTCPQIGNYPSLERHLHCFRPILDSRRETQAGNNCWWHLHWPRDEKIWRANKLVVLQLAARPSFVPRFEPTYVSFSANVFVPSDDTREDLRYLCALLNSRVLWAWFEQNAKHRGIGLELNGHVLEQAPIRRIDFQNPSDIRAHDELVELVTIRMALEKTLIEGAVSDSKIRSEISDTESRIDGIVGALYGIESADIEIVNALTER